MTATLLFRGKTLAAIAEGLTADGVVPVVKAVLTSTELDAAVA